jgi:hypothetical protein
MDCPKSKFTVGCVTHMFFDAFVESKTTKNIRYQLPLHSGVPRGVVWGGGSNPSRNSEVLTKLSRMPSSVENTSITVQCSYSIILISLKIAEFRTPTPQDVWKKAAKF